MDRDRYWKPPDNFNKISNVDLISAVSSVGIFGIRNALSGSMKRAIWPVILFIILMGASKIHAQPAQSLALDRNAQTRDEDSLPAFEDPSYSGKPLSYWLKSIRNRDDQMGLAFDAIRNLGPAAYAAVPDLILVVSEPLTPIEVGVDGYSAVAQKLRVIRIHSSAVDCLGAIGKAAAPSAPTLAEWALTPKMILRGIRNREEQDAFVDLVGIDIVERMRVVGAISKFTPNASLFIAGLLKSPNEEARKLGVAILHENALPLAVTLLQSESCGDQELGFNILFDMWPVVARDHLLDLIDVLPCVLPEDRDQ
jgi:hypothetical protein